MVLFYIALQERLLLALPLALQHPLLASDVKSVCTLLQVSSRVRAALRECDVSSLEVDLSSSDASAQAGFAAWLPDHAGLVGKLFIRNDELKSEEGQLLAPTLYTLSLKHAAAQVAHPLRLKAFGTNMLCASMISALPAGSLAHMELHDVNPMQTDTLHAHALLSAVSSFWNLRCFELWHGQVEVTNTCLSGLSQLPHLTKVTLTGCNWASLGNLPEHLQELEVQTGQEDVLIDISHMSGLRNLSVSAKSLAEGSTFPSGLTTLTISRAPLRLHIISHLERLQQLQLENIRSSQNMGFVGCLARLPSLQHVTCGYSNCPEGWKAAVASARTWQKLPQLRELSMYYSGIASPEQEIAEAAAVGQGLSAATSLTKLTLGGVAPPGNICSYVKCLPKLAELCIGDGHFSRDDAFLLKGLTQLTSLELYFCPAVDDAVAVALVSNMPKLQELGLGHCGIKSDALVPVLEELQALRCLSLCGCEGLKDESMQLLARLTQLTELEVRSNPQIRKASREFLMQALCGKCTFHF